MVIRNRSFLSLYAASLLASDGTVRTLYCSSSYATERGIDSGLAATLVGVIGASSIIGRLGIRRTRHPMEHHCVDADQFAVIALVICCGCLPMEHSSFL